MPYTTLSPLSDGNILSAAWLNGLSANQAYVYGVANVANIPFNSYSENDNTVDSTSMIWYIRHRLQYLHWQIKSASAWQDAHVFYNGVKLADGPIAATWNGTYDLSSWAGLANLRGAWVTATAYQQNNNHDGDVVTQSGQYYRCMVDHTSGATTQPGVGASWTTYWALLTLPGVGTICSTHVVINYSSNVVTGVDYILETDSASF